MSQASKKVEWCLKKAEKEIEECKFKGKNPKHRGLIKSEPDIEKAKDFISKAEENLHFAISLKPSKQGYIAISSLFYSMYHCFMAIAAKFGYESRNQSCTISLIEYLNEENKIDLDSKFVDMLKYKEDQMDKNRDSLIEMREDYTYGSKISVMDDKINELINSCREIIEETKHIITNKNHS